MGDYAHIEKERDELFNSFEAQVKQILGAANLDPIEMEKVQASLDDTFSARNQLIKDLRLALVRVTKSYNDSLRTFSQKLTDLGIPHTEIDSMGFVPIPTSASIGPAGLVVK